MFFKAAICLCIATAVSSKYNFYRRDYTYIEEYDAFYKLHAGEGEDTWQQGFIKCDDEGAQFLYPAGDEWRIADNITEFDIEYMHVGVSDESGRGDFITTDGRFIPEFSIRPHNIVENDENGENGANGEKGKECGAISVKTGIYTKIPCNIRKPFMCKKLNNEYCPTADSGYIYSKFLNKCIKINSNEKNWADAMHTCIMEGGILSDSIVNVDAKVLKNLLEDNTQYYIGFRSISGYTFYSSRGAKITIYKQNSNENCATISNGNTINANVCGDTSAFICEMEVNKET